MMKTRLRELPVEMSGKLCRLLHQHMMQHLVRKNLNQLMMTRSLITEEESSRAMFMSGVILYFHQVGTRIFHWNLISVKFIMSLEQGPDSTQEDGLDSAEVGRPKKSVDDKWNIKDLSEVDEQHRIQIFDEKGMGLSLPGTKFKERKDFQGLDELEEYSLLSFRLQGPKGLAVVWSRYRPVILSLWWKGCEVMLMRTKLMGEANDDTEGKDF